MKVKIKGNTIGYPKGATLDEIKKHFIQRIERRNKEIERREWIVAEYRRLQAANATDREWLAWLNTQDPETWGKEKEV